MTKHTPGPWNISRDAVPKHHVQLTVYADSDGERVATVFREHSNAHLIAAAPELLAALEEMLIAFHGLPANESDEPDPICAIAIAAARSAIAKATTGD